MRRLSLLFMTILTLGCLTFALAQANGQGGGSTTNVGVAAESERRAVTEGHSLLSGTGIAVVALVMVVLLVVTTFIVARRRPGAPS